MNPATAEKLERDIGDSWSRTDFDDATRLIVEGYGPQILGYLVRTMRNEPDACEVFSRFCEHLWRGIANFSGRSSFRTWSYTLATHARQRFWEDPYRRRGTRLESEAISKIEEVVRSRTIHYLRTEVKDRFAQIREQLSFDEQTLLTLRIDRDLGWTEIVEILAEPNATFSDEELKEKATVLRQRFQRIKGKIRKLAGEQGLLNPQDPEP